jgi:hypothetical protein
MQMKPTFVVATLIGGVLACAAQAGPQDCTVPMVNWQSRAAVMDMAKDQGWIVRRIKTDDGCYEIYGRDATGRAIEAKIDPGSLAIVEIEYEQDHADHGDDDPKGGDHRGSDD